MKYYLLSVAAMVAFVIITGGCAATPTYITQQGLNVYCPEAGPCLDQSDANIMIDIFAGMSPDTDEILEVLGRGHIHLEVVPEVFECEGSTTGFCLGTYAPGLGLLKVVYKDCIALTALVHELAHMVQDMVHGIDNRVTDMHADTRYFTDSCPDMFCSEQTLVVRANEIGARVICGGQ